MGKKQIATKLIHTGDGQDFKKLTAYKSVPEALPIFARKRQTDTSIRG